MAKKVKNKNKKNVNSFSDDILPQNIVNFGEHVVEDKNIYISQSVYKEIHKFTKDKTTNESGGILFGNVIEEFGKTNIIIRGFIEAKYCEGTPTTLKFTHETWDYVHKEASKKFPKYKILGWIHTHPNFGIFLSEYDKFIQENFFKEDNQIAYVVDPIQNIEGFYFWINEKIERCKGFFVFDNNGKEITVSDGVEQKESHNVEKPSKHANVLIGILSVAVILLLFLTISLNGKINDLTVSLSQSVAYFTERINMQYFEIESLKQRVQALEPTTVAQQSDNQGENNTTAANNENTNQNPVLYNSGDVIGGVIS